MQNIMIWDETKRANIYVLAATAISIIYSSTISWSFLVANGPRSEGSSLWSYSLAPLHFTLIQFSIFLIYAFVFARNIVKVKYIRWLIYPACYIAFYIQAFYTAFIFFSGVTGWLFILTFLPCVIAFLVFEIIAIVCDILDFKNKKVECNNKAPKLQQRIINIILYLFIIPTLAYTIYYAATEANADSKQSSKKCANFYNALQQFTKNVDINLYNNFENLAEYYKKELNKDVYKTMLGNYDNIKTDTGEYIKHITYSSEREETGKVQWISFYLYNNDRLVSEFSFEMDENCSKSKDSCMWRFFEKNPCCSFYQDKDGKIIPTKRTKKYLKYNLN